jgi:hypothetical protein
LKKNKKKLIIQQNFVWINKNYKNMTIYYGKK